MTRTTRRRTGNRSPPASGLVQVVPRARPQYESNGDSGGGGRNWVLIGDDRLFFLFCTNAAGYGWYGRNSYCFGTSSALPGDNYATVLAADDNYRG